MSDDQAALMIACAQWLHEPGDAGKHLHQAFAIGRTYIDEILHPWVEQVYVDIVPTRHFPITEVIFLQAGLRESGLQGRNR